MQRPTTENHPTQSVSDAEAEEHNLKTTTMTKKRDRKECRRPRAKPPFGTTMKWSFWQETSRQSVATAKG